MSKAAGGVLVTRGGSSVYCPVCKFVMSREDIWAGKYDVQERKWWQFWRKDPLDIQETESVPRGAASESPATSKSEGPAVKKGSRVEDDAVDNRLKRLIAGLAGIGHSPDEIVPVSRFIEDLGFDSLDCVELIMAVEEEFEIEVPDTDAARLETVGQAVAYITGPPTGRENVDGAGQPASAILKPAPGLSGSATLVPMRNYGEYLGGLARRLDTPNPDTLYAHHEAFCAECGVQFTREALAHLHLFGSGDFANLTVVGATKAGNDIRSPYEIGSKITSDAFISHHSAFEYHGMANQIFSDIYVSTAIRFNDFEFDGRTYVCVASRSNTGIDSPTPRLRITSLERTIIDNIKDFSKIGGLEELLRCLQMVTYVSESKLLEVLASYGNQFLYQKTGYILSHYKKPMKLSDSLFAACQEKIEKSTRYLYGGIQFEDPQFSKEWRLFVPHDLMKLIDEGRDAIV